MPMSAPQYLPCLNLLDDLRRVHSREKKAVTLVIGDMEKWIAQGRPIFAEDDLTYLDFQDLSSEQVDTVGPEMVVSQLVEDAFDAFQIVNDLKSFGYRGRYRAVARELPNVPMVRSEITAIAPEIDFDIVVLQPRLVAVT